jgi:hypothetical protein
VFSSLESFRHLLIECVNVFLTCHVGGVKQPLSRDGLYK